MELVFILVPIFVYALLRQLFEQRSKERIERMRLLEQALANPQVDRATINALAQQLSGAGRRWAGRGQALLLGLGWLTLFSGLGVLCVGMIQKQSEAWAGGAITTLVGFGLVTYPFALRELEARRQTQ